MSAAFHPALEAVVDFSCRLHERGWVANHDGNVSVRLGDDQFLITPTSVSKGGVRAEMLVVVDGAGRVIDGQLKPPSELALHLTAYRARPEIGAVIHAHPPFMTSLLVAGVDLGHPFLAEAVVSLGASIPVVPFTAPGDPKAHEELAAALSRCDVGLLDRHGVLTLGASLEQAFLRMELVEHLARVSSLARTMGGVRRLPEDVVASLAAKGRPSSARQGVDGAPVQREAATSGHARPDVRGIVSDALSRHRES